MVLRPEPVFRFFLLSWDDVPEAVIVAKSATEAERLLYEHHLKHMGRGTVRHWSWKELPGFGGAAYERLLRPEWDINRGAPPGPGYLSSVDSLWLHTLREEFSHYQELIEWCRTEVWLLKDAEERVAELERELSELRLKVAAKPPEMG